MSSEQITFGEEKCNIEGIKGAFRARTVSRCALRLVDLIYAVYYVTCATAGKLTIVNALRHM